MPALAQVRRDFSHAVDVAAHGGITRISRRGRAVAAIVPADVARIYEEAETAMLKEKTKAAIADAKKHGLVYVGDVRTLI